MFSDSVLITVTKAGIGFTGKGETGSSVVNFAPTGSADDENVMHAFFFFFFENLFVLNWCVL